MKKDLKMKLIFGLLILFSSTLFGYNCDLNYQPILLQSSANYQFYQWTLNYADDLFLEAEENILPLKEYKTWAQSFVDIDPIALLIHQREVFDSTSFKGVYTHRFNYIINGEIGSIRKINCLEATLFLNNFLNKNYKEQPTEFSAHFLVNEQVIKIYIVNSSELWVPGVALQQQLIEKDLKEHWILFNMLHNHPIIVNNPYNDFAGTLIPSGELDYGDVFTFFKLRRNYRLNYFTITNGFNTIEILEADMEKIEKLWNRNKSQKQSEPIIFFQKVI